MKQKVALFAAFALISLLAMSCDSSSSSDVVMHTEDPIDPAMKNPALPSPRSPLAADTLPAPSSGSAWYHFENNAYGIGTRRRNAHLRRLFLRANWLLLGWRFVGEVHGTQRKAFTDFGLRIRRDA